jgi:hypothetical protein
MNVFIKNLAFMMVSSTPNYGGNRVKGGEKATEPDLSYLVVHR